MATLKPAVEPETQRVRDADLPSNLYSGASSGGIMSGKTVAGSGTATVNSGGDLHTATTQTAGYREAGHQTIDPIYRTVDRANETVQGQLEGIMSSNSPLMQRARSKALDQMNSRGLLNSSMAVGAGEAALYDVAVPIATNDANTFSQASRDNQAVGNDTSKFNANAFNTAEQFNAGEFNAAERFNTGEANQTARVNADAGNRLSITRIQEAGQNQRLDKQIAANRQIAELNNAAAVQLEQIRSNNQALIQGSANAGQIYSQGQANIVAIQTDPNLSQAAKDQLINQQLSFMQSGMAVSGRVAGMDFGDILDWGSMQITNTGGVTGPPPRYTAPGQSPAPAPAPTPAYDSNNDWMRGGA